MFSLSFAPLSWPALFLFALSLLPAVRATAEYCYENVDGSETCYKQPPSTIGIIIACIFAGILLASILGSILNSCYERRRNVPTVHIAALAMAPDGPKSAAPGRPRPFSAFLIPFTTYAPPRPHPAYYDVEAGGGPVLTFSNQYEGPYSAQLEKEQSNEPGTAGLKTPQYPATAYPFTGYAAPPPSSQQPLRYPLKQTTSA